MCKRTPRTEKSILRLVLLVPLLPALLSCAEDGGVPPGSGTGSLLIQMQDTPRDNLLKFEISVDSIALDDGSAQVELLIEPVEIELTCLQLTTATIRLSQSIPEGTYTAAAFTFSNPEIKFCPDAPTVCTDQNVVVDNPPLVNSVVSLSGLNLVIETDTAAGLLVDFDLQASVVTDQNGVITGVNPALSFLVRDLDVEVDEFEEEGRVAAVNTVLGTFDLEPFSSCQPLTISVNANTVFEDFDRVSLPNSLDSLAVDQFVEVEADFASNGDAVAARVELENANNGDELEGVVLSHNQDGMGAVTDFVLLVKKIAPCSAPLLAGDLVNVTVDANTTWELDVGDFFLVDPALFDDATDLEVGQRVEVRPVGQLATDVTAQQVELKKQTLLGTVGGITSPLTFEMDPGSDLLTDQSVSVVTSLTTEFDGVVGVTGLIFGQDIRVKGLLLLRFVGGLVLAAEKVDASL